MESYKVLYVDPRTGDVLSPEPRHRTVWEGTPLQVVASCEGSADRAKKHLAMGTCACGIHSTNNLSKLEAYITYDEANGFAVVVALLALSGTVIEGTEGFRSEKATVIQFFTRQPDEIKMLRGIVAIGEPPLNSPMREMWARCDLWKKEGEMIAEKNPDLIIAVFRERDTKIPGVCRVMTADGKNHYVSESSYNKIFSDRKNGTILLLSDCER